MSAGWLLGFLAWFLIWMPLVALLEYATHRWIMHMANRLLDPKLSQLHAHGTHHEGGNGQEFVDMPWRNCLLLASPFFVLLRRLGIGRGFHFERRDSRRALLSWTIIYTYLWTRIHRAIHGVENNWVRRNRRVYRFFRDHHLRHHVNDSVNYGTVFPWTDYVFFTWHRPTKIRDTLRNAEGQTS